MSLRFKITSAAYALMLIIFFHIWIRPFGNELDAFSAFFCMLILSIVALWPASDEASRVENELGRKSWADRVALDERA
jgi:uncharacterized RDD family membrane protein YckC